MSSEELSKIKELIADYGIYAVTVKEIEKGLVLLKKERERVKGCKGKLVFWAMEVFRNHFPPGTIKAVINLLERDLKQERKRLITTYSKNVVQAHNKLKHCDKSPCLIEKILR